MNALPVALETPTPVAKPDLGVLGRILLTAVFLPGLAVGYTSGLGLAFYVPFAGVGAFLILRRPRMTIGWMLFGVGWGFALFSSRVDATAAQFQAGTVEPADLLFLFMHGAGGMLAYLLLPTLVFAFPSGRLPSGRWGRAVRAGLASMAVVLAMVIFAPMLNVNLTSQELGVVVSNPLRVLPDLPIWAVVNPSLAILLFLISLAIAGTSIGVRFRRAVGVERQQLKWLAVAIVLLVFGMILGTTIATVMPGIGNSGAIWLPAIVGFLAVPLSIAIAILRYRLYDINTIINRAIVYGLLTAILTGGSAAVIALGQRLFVGVIGAGSDATIVLTTLLVVTAFNPIKARLQTIVDRRFKDNHGPDAAFDAFVGEVRASLSPPDLHRSIARLLETAVSAHRSAGGGATITFTRRKPWTYATGKSWTGPALVAVTSAGQVEVRLEIARSDEFATADTMQAALEAVVAEASGSVGVALASPIG